MNKRFGFNTIALFTRTNRPIVDFYTKVFGFTTDWDGIQPNVEMRLDDMRLLLFPRKEFEKMVSRAHIILPRDTSSLSRTRPLLTNTSPPFLQRRKNINQARSGVM